MSAVAEQTLSASTEMPPPLVFTDSAAAKVADLIAEEGNPELKLRVFVQGGGCSGFQYGFTFDEIINEDDTLMTKNGVTLLIDAMSYQYLVRRRDRLQGRPAGRAVRDQEPERHHHLRLRLELLGLIRFSTARAARGQPFVIAGLPGTARPAPAAPGAGDCAAGCPVAASANAWASQAKASASTCSGGTPRAAVLCTLQCRQLLRQPAHQVALSAPPPQTSSSPQSPAHARAAPRRRRARSVRPAWPARRPRSGRARGRAACAPARRG